jgi:hypothetical protein
MLCREIMAVCSEIHTKHINTLCGQNVELLNVKLAVRIVTTELERAVALPHQTEETLAFLITRPFRITRHSFRSYK